MHSYVTKHKIACPFIASGNVLDTVPVGGVTIQLCNYASKPIVSIIHGLTSLYYIVTLRQLHIRHIIKSNHNVTVNQ